MNRSLALAATVALLTGQPTLVLAHPIGVSYPRAPVSAPHIPVRGGSTNPDGFRVPSPLEVPLKPLPELRPFAPLTRLYPQAFPPLHRWYGWLWTPRYLLLPAFYGTGCYATNGVMSSANEQQPFDVTLGSLVDGKANLLAPSTYNKSLFVADDKSQVDQSSNPFSVDAGYRPGCGLWNFPLF